MKISLEEVYHNMFEFGCCNLHTIVSLPEESWLCRQPATAPKLMHINH